MIARLLTLAAAIMGSLLSPRYCGGEPVLMAMEQVREGVSALGGSASRIFVGLYTLSNEGIARPQISPAVPAVSF